MTFILYAWISISPFSTLTETRLVLYKEFKPKA